MTRAQEILQRAKKKVASQPNWADEAKKNMKSAGEKSSADFMKIIKDQQETAGRLIFGKYWK